MFEVNRGGGAHRRRVVCGSAHRPKGNGGDGVDDAVATAVGHTVTLTGGFTLRTAA
jgi:hypothetical protein